MKKKLLALAMAVVLILSLLPAAALAAGETVSTAAELKKAIEEAPTDGSQVTITLSADITGMISDDIVTIKAGQNIVLDMAGHSITVASDFTGRPVRNEGTLTVTGNGTIDSSNSNTGGYGAIDNYGTLTIENGTFTGSVNASGASIKNRPDGILTIENGTFNGAVTAVYNAGIAKIYNGLFDCRSCSSCNSNSWGYTIQSHMDEDGKSPQLYFYNGTVIGVQGAFSTSAGYSEIYDGTFKTVPCAQHPSGNSAYYAMYIAGEDEDVKCVVYGGYFESASRTAALIGNDNTGGDGGINANATTEIKGGTFVAPTGQNAVTGAEKTGNPIITGGSFSSNVSVYVTDGYEMVQRGDQYVVGTAEELAVAEISGTKYTTLEEAFNKAQSGDTVKLIADVTVADGIELNKGADTTLTLDINGCTYTVLRGGDNANNRGFKITSGTLNVIDSSADKSGMMIAAGSGTTSTNGSGAYGVFRVEAGGTLNVTGVTLKNSRPWGMNVKICGGTATLTDVTIISSYGGGIEVTEADLGEYSQAGTATMTNCTVIQTGYFDHCSSAVAVSGGSKLTVNGGSYTSEGTGIYVFSSGGVIEVLDGSFSGGENVIRAEIDTGTYPEYAGDVQIKGGNYTGTFQITSPATLEISGGYFTTDPSAYVAEGKAALTSDVDGYAFKVGDAVQTEVEVTPAAGDPVVKDELLPDDMSEPDKTAVTNAAASVNDNGALAAAANQAIKEVTEQQVSNAEAAYKGSEITGAADADNITVYAQTYLDIKPTGYVTAEGQQSLTLDIIPMYRVVATTAASADQIKVDGEIAEGETPNAVVLDGSEKELTGIQTMTISITLPNDFLSGASNVYVKHMKNSVLVGYHAATVNGSTLTFTNDKGFSTFEIKADNRTAQVKFGADANATTLTPADVNSDLPEATAPAGQAFSGWTFDGIEGTYTTLTDELLTKLDDLYTNTAITATAQFYTPAPVTPVTPDEPEALPFTDVAETDWFYDAVYYVYDKGLMNGVTDTTFEPKADTSRAMLVTILWRLEGSPVVTAAADFSDVAEGSWYADAVAWAAANEIVNGMGDGTFAPSAPITRQQMAAVLYRYATYKGYDVTKAADLSVYADSADVQAYAVDAMAWANAEGLITGVTDTTLVPAGSAIRAQSATILMRFAENVAK